MGGPLLFAFILPDQRLPERPAAGDWLYFVTIDLQGTTLFTKDYPQHLANIEQYFLAPLPASHRQRFMDDLRILSHAARDVVPRLR